MKRLLALCLCSLTTLCALAQTTYTLPISDSLVGTVHLEQPTEVFSPGWIAVTNRQTGKQLIKVESTDIALSLHEGKALANIKQLPYGEQSVIIYEDFNFDGVNDLAISDGQESCYHGPSFNIYLATKDKFTLSPEFTRLAHEYCGMFQVDAGEKKLRTMTKSGCCWHEYSEFVVENNKPKAVQIEVDDQSNGPIRTYMSSTWDGKKMVKKIDRRFEPKADDDASIVFSFDLQNSDKKVALLSWTENMLVYALVRKKDDTIEFLYPNNFKSAGEQFQFDSYEGTLEFSNGNTRYEIYEDSDGNPGVRVTVKGRTTDLKGITATKKGSLDLNDSQLANVSVSGLAEIVGHKDVPKSSRDIPELARKAIQAAYPETSNWTFNSPDIGSNSWSKGRLVNGVALTEYHAALVSFKNAETEMVGLVLLSVAPGRSEQGKYKVIAASPLWQPPKNVPGWYGLVLTNFISGDMWLTWRRDNNSCTAENWSEPACLHSEDSFQFRLIGSKPMLIGHSLYINYYEKKDGDVVVTDRLRCSTNFSTGVQYYAQPVEGKAPGKPVKVPGLHPVLLERFRPYMGPWHGGDGPVISKPCGPLPPGGGD